MMSDTLNPLHVPARKPVRMFRDMLLQGWLHRLLAKLTRRPFHLLDLEAALRSSLLEASYSAGLKTVSIDRIRGTEGKGREFDADFNPTQECSLSRWIGVAREKMRGHDLPPVDLVQVGDIYYVRDGHHRISVSRAMGQAYIDAEVTIMRLHQRSMLR